MRRSQRTLLALAVAGWAGAIASQLRAIRADDEEGRSKWTVTRNQCLLLSSITMNTLALTVLYGFVKKLGRKTGRSDSPIELLDS